jgi:hypothetical protein
MRSYCYKGTHMWEVHKDNLVPTAMKRDEWQEKEAFRADLEKSGFNYYHKADYQSRIGNVIVFARDHAKLPTTRAAGELKYDFLCVIDIAGTYIRVWIPELPTLLLFMQEIETSVQSKLNQSAENLLDSDTIYEFLTNVSNAMLDFVSGTSEITVKQEKKSR